MWMAGRCRRRITAKIVIASAKRLIEVRQFCRNRKRIAEISVPAWPMPTQNTKLTMSKPQPTGLLLPQTPTPIIWLVPSGEWIVAATGQTDSHGAFSQC
jgi:hypothetical protein